VVADVDVLGSFIKVRVLREDNSSLVVTIDLYCVAVLGDKV
jgi:hypothetical protein